MPRTYITLEERTRAERKNQIDKKSRQLKEKMATIKHGVGYEKIREQTGYSLPTITKIINKPQKATIEQLLSVCSVAGVELSIQ